MEIKHQQGEKTGNFYYTQNGKKLALMAYVWAGSDKLIIDHTEVDESLKGKGVGKELLKSLVAFVRDQNIKVIPLCPFAKATFQKTPDWQDVLT